MTDGARLPLAQAAPGVGEVTALAYRNAMARMGSSVHVITTDGPAGKAGFTATAVCSITDKAPTLLTCVNLSSSVGRAFEGNAVFCVNTLATRQEHLANLFGGKTPGEERFAAARWTTGETGAPILIDSIVSLECRVTQRIYVGTHIVLFGEVAGIAQAAESTTLIYVDRRYHHIGAGPDSASDRGGLRQ